MDSLAAPEAVSPEQERRVRRLRVMAAMVTVWADRHQDQVKALVDSRIPHPFKGMAFSLLNNGLSNFGQRAMSLNPKQLDEEWDFVSDAFHAIDGTEDEWQAWYETTKQRL